MSVIKIRRCIEYINVCTTPTKRASRGINQSRDAPTRTTPLFFPSHGFPRALPYVPVAGGTYRDVTQEGQYISQRQGKKKKKEEKIRGKKKKKTWVWVQYILSLVAAPPRKGGKPHPLTLSKEKKGYFYWQYMR